MSKQESGRMLLKNATLIEYENTIEGNTFFLQLGIAGFYANESELHDLYSLLNYYYNMDAVSDTVISLA